jgi:hypothetical protein
VRHSGSLDASAQGEVAASDLNTQALPGNQSSAAADLSRAAISYQHTLCHVECLNGVPAHLLVAVGVLHPPSPARVRCHTQQPSWQQQAARRCHAPPGTCQACLL